MTMRLKKSLETSWNVDGKQLRELKSQWTTKFYRFFAKENFHFFLYRHGGPINMQSIAAEEQNVKMELTKWDSRSISGIQSLQSHCKSDLFWGCSKQQPHGVALQFLELLLKNGPFKKLVHVSGGDGEEGRRGEFSTCMNFSGSFLITLNNFSGVRSLSWAAERGHHSWFV